MVNNWYTFYTPDYFNSVCNNNYCDQPINNYGYCQPKNGNAYAGTGLYQKGNEAKEYIYQYLSNPLQMGKTYCLNFYISRAERSTYAVKNIEAYFSSSSPSMPNGNYINVTPQIIKQNNFITDTMQWIQIQGCFTAQGGEQYLTIGNFNSNTNTDTLFVGTNNPIPGYGDFSYYYIDDVYLYDALTTGINEQGKENDIEVYPNPNNGFFEINNLPEEKCVLRITNALGQLVYTTILHQPKNIIDLSKEKEGIYFYHILINDKIIKTDKIVIIK